MSESHNFAEEAQAVRTQTPPWIGLRPEGWKEDSSEFVVSQAGMQPMRRKLSPRRRVLLYLALLVAAPVVAGSFLGEALPLWAFALGGMLQLAMVARGRDSWDDGVWVWLLSAGILVGLCWLDHQFFTHYLAYAAALGVIAFLYGTFVRQTGMRKIIALLAILAGVHVTGGKFITPVYILAFLGCVWAAIWALMLPRISRPAEMPGVEENIWNPAYGLRLGLAVGIGAIAEHLIFGTNTSLGAIAAACVMQPEKNPRPSWLAGSVLGALLGATLALSFFSITPPLPLAAGAAALLLCAAALCTQRQVFCFTLAQAACMTVLLGMALPGTGLAALPVFAVGVIAGALGMLAAPWFPRNTAA